MGQDDGHMWGQFVGGGLSREASASHAAYQGLIGGTSITTTSGFAGLHHALYIGAMPLEFTLTADYNSNDSRRDIAGAGIANATYASYFISPSVTMNSPMGLGNASLRLRYLGTYSDGYTETGASSSSIDARSSHFAEARLKFETGLTENISARYGLDAQFANAGAIDITLVGGAPRTGLAASSGWAARGFIGVDLNISQNNGRRTSVAAEIGYGSNGQFDASLTLKVEF